MIKPYIFFDGNCEKAFALYCRAFGGTRVHMQKYGELPHGSGFEITEEQRDLVLNAQIRLTENGYLMGCDSTHAVDQTSNISISIELASQEKALAAWACLCEGGTVLMELAPTFFAKLHGSLKDRYGVCWMFTVA